MPSMVPPTQLNNKHTSGAGGAGGGNADDADMRCTAATAAAAASSLSPAKNELALMSAEGLGDEEPDIDATTVCCVHHCRST